MSPNSPDLAFKTLARVLVEKVGGLEAAAACTRVRRAQLGNYQSPNQDDAFMPVDVVARLEEVAGLPLITRELANRCRHALVPVEAVADGELAALMAKVGAESGGVFQEFAQALGNDGQVDAVERAGLALKLSELLRVTHAALGFCQARPTPVPSGDRGAA